MHPISISSSGNTWLQLNFTIAQLCSKRTSAADNKIGKICNYISSGYIRMVKINLAIYKEIWKNNHTVQGEIHLSMSIETLSKHRGWIYFISNMKPTEFRYMNCPVSSQSLCICFVWLNPWLAMCQWTSVFSLNTHWRKSTIILLVLHAKVHCSLYWCGYATDKTICAALRILVANSVSALTCPNICKA